jgi:3-oxoacyl-[acyl-carrier protein] reductase
MSAGSFASLDGKVALVTGASRGIGKAIALELGRAGADVVLSYQSGREEAEAVAAEIGGRAVGADVSDASSAKALVDEAGDLDILVNNAGVTRDGVLARLSDDDWRAVIDTNLSSVFYTCRAAARPMMKRRGGAIVNVSSIVGLHGNFGQTNYAASKAGVIGMVRAWAPAFAERGATINAVAPGFIVTEMTAKMPFGTREVGSRINSLQQGGLPVDVAETIAWLSQPSAAGVNGQVVRVCGQSMLGA